MGYRVLIIPHVQRPELNENDLVLGTELIREMSFPERVHVAALDFSASELKALIAGAEYNLSERMHAAIAGISTGIPTAVVGYSVKARGILGDIYGHDTAPKWCLSVGAFLDPEKRKHFLRATWDSRDQLKSHLKQVIPSFLKLAAHNFDLMAKLLYVDEN
jgi:colanic acid/amylovoran biosynthesis protein